MSNLTKLTAQELMELAKKPLKDNDKSLKKLPIVRQFIISEKIVQGDYNIPAMLVYDRFKKWCFIHGYRIITVTAFFRQFKLYFPRISKKGTKYALSPEGFDLSEQYIKQVNTEYMKEKRTSHEKKEISKKEKNKEKV